MLIHLAHHMLGDALRVALLLSLALLAMPLLRGTSSATRRLVLAISLGGALVLPLVSATVPSWHVETPDAVADLRAVITSEPLIPSSGAAGTARPGEAAPVSLLRSEVARSLDATALLACLWAAGVARILARLLLGFAKTWQVVRRATRASSWALAASRAERATGQHVQVRATGELDAPAVAGIFTPVILVPSSSFSWTDERRYAVLLHELAHVRQRDCLAQVVTQLACALHWFNPLVWVAARRLHVERELAADDAVVAAGTRASSYAEDLLAIATAGLAREVPIGALGMAERSLIATRVTAIVSARRPRRPVTPAGAALLTASVGAGVLAVACATPATLAAKKTEPSSTAALLPAPSTGASSVDPRLQGIAEEELGHAMDQWTPAAGTVLVLDPTTGEILANAGRANGAAADVAVRRALVTGSTIKPFTLAAALEEGTLSPTDRIDCEKGEWSYQGKTIHDSAPHGVLTIPEMLAVSTNVGFAKVYDRLGGERLGHWLRAFHFGTAPALDGAASGTVLAQIEDHSVAGMMTAIGEKATASPLQVAAAYGALANGGFYVAPTLVRRVGEAPREAILKPETARTVVAMLEHVVSDEQATGTRARVEGQRVAGKTGTASWTLPDGKEGIYASFVGIIPSSAPRYVILVGLEQPQGEDANGGSAAAPVFARVATRALAP